jgi:hypothetical protein
VLAIPGALEAYLSGTSDISPLERVRLTQGAPEPAGATKGVQVPPGPDHAVPEAPTQP